MAERVLKWTSRLAEMEKIKTQSTSRRCRPVQKWTRKMKWLATWSSDSNFSQQRQRFRKLSEGVSQR